MHKLIVLYPWPADPAAFKRYYEEKHLPLAARLPGLLGYSFGYPQGLGPDRAAYFCVFEARFADEAAMGAAMGSSAGAAVAADVANYSAPPTILHMAVAGGSG